MSPPVGPSVNTTCPSPLSSSSSSFTSSLPLGRLPEGILMERRESIGTMFSRQLHNSTHFHSAALDDKLSPLQLHRQKWDPTLPLAMRGPVKLRENKGVTAAQQVAKQAVPQADRETLAKLFPNTWHQPYVELVPSDDATVWQKHRPLRLGVVLSGGQAAGGHNVISGVYDYVKQCNPNSQVFGFLGGPHGIFTHQYVEIQDDFMNRFRNQGGFDMIRSGRHKIETEPQKAMSLEICQKLDLHGLIVIGGDDSNTNAAIIGEYFKTNNCNTCVVGCPKTIDGDLRNEYIEASFGFDTAVKTFSEFVGNLCEDVATSGRYYHFVRLMGRSASHITLECALQTRPNLVFIGEEVQAKQMSLKDIVSEIIEMIVKRHEMGRDYGVVLLPEGLIEFIPEVGVLISEINSLMAHWDSSAATATSESISAKLSTKSREVFELLPSVIRQQLLLDRDPHGNVQVAMIATERLLILMVQAELQRRAPSTLKFNPMSHYFGYEGRCGMPSVFDANYCYSLGHVAAALIDNGVTGCMAVLKGLRNRPEVWMPGGCPLTLMMNIEIRKGKPVPVIKKYLVELDKPLFKLFSQAREEWKVRDLYRSPGPIQFEGLTSDISNFSICPPTIEELVPQKPALYDVLKKRHHFVKSKEQMSFLQRVRLYSPVSLNAVLLNPESRAICGTRLECRDQEVARTVNRSYPLQTQLSKNLMLGIGTPAEAKSPKACEPLTPTRATRASGSSESPGTGGKTEGNISPSLSEVMEKKGKGLMIGVVLTGQQAPGAANVVCGLFERARRNGGRLFGFKGAFGLLENDCIELNEEDLDRCQNQGGFDVLGRTASSEPLLATAEGVKKIKATCIARDLDGLVMIGGCWTLTDCAIVTESFLLEGVKTRVIGVPCTQNNNIDSRFIECTIGFDSASKCYSQLIGNLLTDAASATKYWYFIRLMGRDKSHMVVETSLQTHSNVTLVSELLSAGNKTLQDVVMDIADVICGRAERGKNFGAVLIPEGLITELPQMRQLLTELGAISAPAADDPTQKSLMISELVKLDSSTSKFSGALTSWSWTLLKTLPEFIREQLVQPRTLGRIQHSKIASEEMLSQMVGAELQRRKTDGGYCGSFSPVCFYFGYQARSSLPSFFDSALGMSHGYLSGICVESGLTGYVTSMRGLCAAPNNWRPIAVPVSCLLRTPPPDEKYATKVPMVLSETVRLGGKALLQVQAASHMWEQEDRFCNPGPLQFFGDAMYYFTRYLFEQQHNYLRMLAEVGEHLSYLKQLCTFGVDDLTLSTTYHSLETLSKLIEAIQKSTDRGGYTTVVPSAQRPLGAVTLAGGSLSLASGPRLGAGQLPDGGSDYLRHMSAQFSQSAPNNFKWQA